MQADPNQFTNQAKNTAHVETIAELRQRMDEWIAKVKGNADKKLKEKK